MEKKNNDFKSIDIFCAEQSEFPLKTYDWKYFMQLAINDSVNYWDEKQISG